LAQWTAEGVRGDDGQWAGLKDWVHATSLMGAVKYFRNCHVSFAKTRMVGGEKV